MLPYYLLPLPDPNKAAEPACVLHLRLNPFLEVLANVGAADNGVLSLPQTAQKRNVDLGKVLPGDTSTWST